VSLTLLARLLWLRTLVIKMLKGISASGIRNVKKKYVSMLLPKIILMNYVQSFSLHAHLVRKNMDVLIEFVRMLQNIRQPLNVSPIYLIIIV
jgi:hypothetical protein